MNTTAPQRVGTFLKDCREHEGLSPEAAAAHLDLAGAPEILRIESGHRSLSLGEIYAFANIYNVPPERVIELILNLPFHSDKKNQSHSPTAN